jgi:uncharacterized membrane protein
MAILLGIGSAVVYGAADFVGGLMTRRSNAFTVTFLSQVIGTFPLAVLVPLIGGTYSTSALWWGAGSGLAGASGVLLLYRGLGIGRMSVLAPVTAVEAATVPVLFGLASGERPSTLALTGVLVAIVAITLVSSSPDENSTTGSRLRAPGMAEALGAGLFFGVFFILLERAGDDSGIWPLVGARIASVSLLGIAVVLSRSSLRTGVATTMGIGAAGILDVGANIFYLLATHEGLLSLVAVLTSLYPASTVLLARVVLKERLIRIQMVGLGLAGAGVSLIALG